MNNIKWITKASLSLMALAAFASAQEAIPFKVYGFADMNVQYNKSASSFNTQFLGPDTMSISLGHANIYFDFNPITHIKALLEVGFSSTKSSLAYNIGSDTNLFVDSKGSPISDMQVISAATAMKMAQLADSILGKGATAAQLEAAAPGTTASVETNVSKVVAAAHAAQVANAQNARRFQNISIQRAYFDLVLNDGNNLRMGQFITPAGIWNVDHGSPVVLTIRQPMETSIVPIFPESQLGLMYFGRQYLGDHDLNYNVYVTTGRTGPSAASIGHGYDNSIDKPSDLAYGGHVGLKLDMLKGISIGASAMTGTMREKYQNQQASLDIISMLLDTVGEAKVQNVVYNDYFNIKDREFIYGGDAKIEVGKLTLQGECNYRRIDNEKDNQSGTTNMLGYYGLLAYKLPLGTDYALTPYAMYENVGWKSSNGGAGSITDDGINGFYTVAAGLNFSIFTNFHFKLEYDRLQLLLNSKSSASFPSSIKEKDLVSNIISSQFSVAF